MNNHFALFLGLIFLVSITNVKPVFAEEFLATEGNCGNYHVQIYATPVDQILGTASVQANQSSDNQLYAVESLHYGNVADLREVVTDASGYKSESTTTLTAIAMKDNDGSIQLDPIAGSSFEAIPLNAESLKGNFVFHADTQNWGTPAGIIAALAVIDKTGTLTPLGNDLYGAKEVNLKIAHWSFACSGGPLVYSAPSTDPVGECPAGLSRSGDRCIITN